MEASADRFLAALGLQQYVDPLVAEGYDKLKDIASLGEDEMLECHIQQEHAAVLLGAIDVLEFLQQQELAQHFQAFLDAGLHDVSSAQKAVDVLQFLQQQDLAKYFEAFLAAKFCDMSSVQTATKEDMVKCGMLKGHMKRLDVALGRPTMASSASRDSLQRRDSLTSVDGDTASEKKVAAEDSHVVTRREGAIDEEFEFEFVPDPSLRVLGSASLPSNHPVSPSDVDVEMADADCESSVVLPPDLSRNESTEEQPVDMGPVDSKAWLARLSRLLEHSRASLEDLRDKRGILFMGNTGAGKTLLLHFLCDSNINVREGLRGIGEVFEADPTDAALQAFNVGHAKISKTEEMMSYGRKGSDFLYIDSAGKFDSRGEELNLATVISYKRAAEVCKSLRFVVVISCCSFFDARAGLLKDIAKNVGCMVSDFEKHQSAFSFIFSHLQHLSSFQHRKGLDDVRKEIEKEIEEAILGTTDSAARFVLRRMKQCVAKRSLADIYCPHWETPSRQQLRQQIEVMDAKANILDPKDVIRCHFTAQSEHQLKLHLQRFLDDVEPMFGREEYAEVIEGWNFLEKLGTHVPAELDFVIKQCEEYGDLVEGRRQNIHREAVNLVALGSSDTGVAFSHTHVKQLQHHQESLSQLNATQLLSDLGSHLAQQLAASVRVLQEVLQLRKMNDVADCLDNLQTWASADMDVDGKYNTGKELLRSHLQDSLVPLRESSIGAKVQAALRLRLCGQCPERLERHLPSGFLSSFGEELDAAIAEVHQKLGESAKAAATNVLCAIEDGDAHTAQVKLTVYSNNAGTLQEVLQLSTASEGLLSDLQKTAQELNDGLSTSLQEGLQGLCDRAQKCLEGGDTEHLQPIMISFANLRLKLADDKNAKGIEQMYSTVLSKVREAVHDMCTAVKTQLEMLQEGGSGVQPHSLSALRSACWFDDLLPAEEQFARKELDAASKKITAASRNSAMAFFKALESYLALPAGTGSRSETQLQAMWCQLDSLLKMEDIFSHKVREENEERVGKLVGQCVKNCLGTRVPLPADLATFRAVGTEKLLEMDADLRFLPKALGALKGAVQASQNAIDTLTQMVQTLLDGRGPFEDLYAAYREFQRWFCKNLRNLLDRLPSTQKLQGLLAELLKNMVSAITESLEKGLLDEASTSLSKMEDLAKKLGPPKGESDDTISAALRADVSLCKQKVELKKQKATKEFQEAIDFFNFEAVIDCVRPVEGDEQENKSRSVRLAQIDKCVRRRVQQAVEGLTAVPMEGGDDVIKEAGSHCMTGISDLMRADTQVGKLLKDAGMADLQSELEHLKEALQSKLRQLMEAVQHSLKERNYGKVVTTNRAATAYRQSFDSVLSESLKREHAKLEQAVNSKLDAIPLQVGEFCKKLEELVQKPSTIDSSKLVEELHALKAAKEEASISKIYCEQCSRLVSACEGFHRAMCTKVTRDQNFREAHELYGCLSKSLAGGLDLHLPGLSFDVSSELTRLLEKHKECNQRVKDAFCSEQEIQRRTKPEYDRLSRMYSWSLWGRRVPSPDYEALQKVLDEALGSRMKAAGVELQTGNYEVAAGFALEAMQMWKHLNMHLCERALFEVMFGELGKNLKHSLTVCTASILESLTVEKANQLEMHLNHLLTFARHVLPVMGGGEMRYSLPRNFAFSVQGYGEACKSVHNGLAALAQRGLDAAETAVKGTDFHKLAACLRHVKLVAQLFCCQVAAYQDELFEQRVPTDEGLLKVMSLQSRLCQGQLYSLGKHYTVLGLPTTASPQETNKRYHQLSKDFHSDRQHLRKIVHWDEDAMQKRINSSNEALRAFFASGSYTGKLAVEVPDFLVQRLATTIDELPGQIDVLLQEQAYQKAVRVVDSLRGVVDVHAVCPLRRSVEEITQGIHRRIKQEVQRISAGLQALWHREDWAKLQQELDKLSSLSEHFSKHADIYSDDWRNSTRRELESKVDALCRKARSQLHKSTEQVREFALCIVPLGRISEELKDLKRYTNSRIQLLLDDIHDQAWGFDFLFKLGMLLENGFGDEGDDDRSGKAIVSEFKHFADVRTILFNQQTAPTQKNIEDTINEVRAWDVQRNGLALPSSSHVQTDALKSGYETYLKVYKDLFDKWGGGLIEPQQIPKLAGKMVASLPKCTATEFPHSVKALIPELLAHVFSFFTISKSGVSYRRLRESSSNEGEGKIKEELILIKPHDIQIFSLLHLLGFDSNDEQLNSRLTQVRTGEGKSIILGGLSAVCALLGFQVRCVCYSAYLSQRDQEMFKEVFTSFGVQDRVRYSTISDFSEDTTSAQGDIRQLSLDLLLGHHKAQPSPVAAAMQLEQQLAGTSGGTSLKPTASTAQQLLLVDEVDIFFGKDFYGRTYNQVAMLESVEVTQVLKFLWGQHDHKDNPRAVLQVLKSDCLAYKSLLSRFPSWAYFLNREVEAMAADLKDFDAVPFKYDRTRNRIGYKVMDGYDYNLVYGYRTAFAYLQEASRGNLRDEGEALKCALRLRMPCGQFSYANIGKPVILGVSGTLSALNKNEWQIMRGFGITRYCEVPSVYGKSNFAYGNPRITISAKNDHFRDITDQANALVQPRIGRAVIIFFRDLQHLREFEESPYWTKLASKKKLDESLDDKEKGYVVKKAATPRQVTLATAVFGRGTDFFSTDVRLEQAGGVHVIQTFFSGDQSEEEQLMGRTARQGKKGTFAWVLSVEEVERLCGGAERLKNQEAGEQWRTLHQARLRRADETFKQVQADLVAAEARDKLTRTYFEALRQGKSDEACAHYSKLYEAIMPPKSRCMGKCRMVCLSDATGSMSGIWAATRAQIITMLERVGEFAGDGSLELLWIAYKDYSDPQLLEKSPWCTGKDAAALQQFVSGIVCGGGGDGPEAVEAALMEARREHQKLPVSRILLIGDAPPHFESKGSKLTHHNHVLTTDYRTEATELAKLGIPVFSFVVGDHEKTMETFTAISQPQNMDAEGKAEWLKSPDQLIDVVCIQALEAIGGSELVAEYTKKYS